MDLVTSRALCSDHTPPPAPATLPAIVLPSIDEMPTAPTRQTPPPWLWSAWLPLTVLWVSTRALPLCRMPPPRPFTDVLPLMVERSIAVAPLDSRPPPELTAVLKVI